MKINQLIEPGVRILHIALHEGLEVGRQVGQTWKQLID